ncbi:MAG: hypothetical protein HY016_13165 [Nitrosomonadales bacterium]|nr:hypothetical protein [Nitrosomonadales bacterium]
MKTSRKLLTGIATLAISLHAHAYPGESIVLDPATGNYTITYRGDSNSTDLSQTVFVPSTKVVPSIRSGFHLGEKSAIVYRYTVSNGTTAKQAIVSVVLDQIIDPIVGELPFPLDQNETKENIDAYRAATKAALSTPANWYGSIIRVTNEDGSKLNRVAWRPKPPIRMGGIPAGHTLTGFGFSSVDLPGVGPSQMDGLGEVLGFPDEGPIESSAIKAELDRIRDNDFVTRPAAVPTIAVPVPFNAAVLLERIQTQMHTWIGMKLLDPTFSSQLDRYFQSAISAYRLNQPKVGKKQIETMRELIEKEHQDLGHDEEHDSDKSQEKNDDRQSALIGRLAARVLDFDLKYVLKRMDDDEDRGHKK